MHRCPRPPPFRGGRRFDAAVSRTKAPAGRRHVLHAHAGGGRSRPRPRPPSGGRRGLRQRQATHRHFYPTRSAAPTACTTHPLRPFRPPLTKAAAPMTVGAAASTRQRSAPVPTFDASTSLCAGRVRARAHARVPRSRRVPPQRARAPMYDRPIIVMSQPRRPLQQRGGGAGLNRSKFCMQRPPLLRGGGRCEGEAGGRLALHEAQPPGPVGLPRWCPPPCCAKAWKGTRASFTYSRKRPQPAKRSSPAPSDHRRPPAARVQNSPQPQGSTGKVVESAK